VALTRRQMARILRLVPPEAWGRTAVHTETGLVEGDRVEGSGRGQCRQTQALACVMGEEKDCHMGMAKTTKDVPSTVRRETAFLKSAGIALRIHEPSSFVCVITGSPYWYIRGMTPHCLIRRW
jgi:hypothetical protein